MLRQLGGRRSGCVARPFVVVRSPLRPYSPSPDTPEGKAKVRERKRLYRLRNVEKIQQQQRQYRAEHGEALKGWLAEYRAKHGARIKEQQRAYRARHRTALLEKRRAFRAANKECIREEQRRYYLTTKDAKRAYQRLHRKPRRTKTWTSLPEVKEFLLSAASQLHVQQPTDWYRISRYQIQSIGGSGLYGAFGNLGKALQFAFPEVDWDQSKFSVRGKKSTQRWMRVLLQQLLPPDTLILEDYLHPDLFWDDIAKYRMELDVWVPEYNLALEYQGEHHYYDLHCAYGPNGTAALYSERDLKKKRTCSQSGITLAIIPYWWDGKKESLSSTLYELRPDLFAKCDSPPIPPYPSVLPKRDIPVQMDQLKANQLMNGQEWNGEQDPTGWIISEKLDGFRAYWDGSSLISKNGKSFSVPSEFTSKLPSNVCLDGELWLGYGEFSTLFSIFIKTYNLQGDSQKLELWKDVKYCVFDAPKHPGYYLERHAFASATISSCGNNVIMIPVEECLGMGHLQTKLEKITEKKGEGIMLYNPKSIYMPGRTSNLLKVKAYKEEDVRFIKCSPNSYSFLCEQKNGTRCIVKCSGWDYMFPPSPGTVLTVKHSGLFKNSQKMKFPFLLRVRSDLSWNTENEGKE